MSQTLFLGLALLALGGASAEPHPVVPQSLAAKPPGASSVPTARAGKYQVELRVPEAGLYAGEEVDVEFRLSDTTGRDPIDGFRGVPNASPSAVVTMPSMPGMPEVHPKIHREGVPGDYGIELYFPHGGEFQIALNLSLPGEKPLKAAFRVNVKDAEARKNAVATKPFAVELLDLPSPLKAAEPFRLRLAIRDTKTGDTIKRFDIAHTKPIHLIVVSRDLGWFVHAHPKPQPDGSFVMPWTFPAGGDYLVFADVAPKDQGSQVLSTPVHVIGAKGTWPTKLVPTQGPSRAPGIVAEFRPSETPIPVGRTTVVSFRLRDQATGRPITDLQPYLGAHGHLMIVHQDGRAFVHSHPAEDAASTRFLSQGEVRFTARFPKPGLYKAWAQFQRAGKVVTVPYVFKVTG